MWSSKKKNKAWIHICTFVERNKMLENNKMKWKKNEKRFFYLWSQSITTAIASVNKPNLANTHGPYPNVLLCTNVLKSRVKCCHHLSHLILCRFALYFCWIKNMRLVDFIIIILFRFYYTFVYFRIQCVRWTRDYQISAIINNAGDKSLHSRSRCFVTFNKINKFHLLIRNSETRWSEHLLRILFNRKIEIFNPQIWL